MSTPLPPLSAFSIVKNAELLDYPIQASIRSVLPLCEEVVVNVGRSADRTLDVVRAIADRRVRVLEREWPEGYGSWMRELSAETNRAMDACRHDWAVYLQADEVLHEDDYPAIRSALVRAAADARAEGLLFHYLHFEGSPEWVLWGRRRYRREVRIVRRSSGVRSVRDAQGFRIGAEERRPRVIRSGARIFHYGYLKSADGLQRKKRLFARSVAAEEGENEPFRFRRYSGLRRFDGTHPASAREWLAAHEWRFDPQTTLGPPLDLKTLKVRISDAIEARTGRRLFEHRNYEMLR
ncbi:MAG: glycosyltransferase [Gemmatimonadota bacterium]